MLVQRLLNITLTGAEWVLYLLLILSVLSVTIMIEKIIIFRMRQTDRKRLNGILQGLNNQEIDSTIRQIENGRSSFERLFAYIIKNGKDPHKREEAISIALSREKLSMEKRLAFLGTVGNNAPFIGLFGTVLGIIKAFHDLSLNQQGGAAIVMAGISEALVATALGLLVAIPAVVAYNYFTRWIKRILTEAETAIREAFLINDSRGEGKDGGQNY